MGCFGLGRLVISANFQSESFLPFSRFGQSLKVIMYALLYVYGWTDGLVKNQAKTKKGPFRIRAETTRIKIPQAGPKRPVTVTV